MQRQLPLGFFLLLAAVGVLAAIPAIRTHIESMQPAPEVKRADVVYFYNPNCAQCRKVAPFVQMLEEGKPDWKIVRVNTGPRSGFELLLDYGSAYNLGEKQRARVPALFFEKRRRAMVGEASCVAAVKALLPAKVQEAAPAKTR